MKNYLIVLFALTLAFFSSCKKEEITPGNYTNSPIVEDTVVTPEYSKGGTIPGTTPLNSELVGTTWVLTKVMAGFATTTDLNDTIRFVTNMDYSINGGATRPYNITSGVSSTNKTLTLYYFYPFGGSHYSGEVGHYFVSDGVINQAEFINIQNTTTTVKAWFEKI